MSTPTNRQVNIYIESGDAQKTFDALITKQKNFQEQLKNATDPKVVQRLTDELNKLAEPIDKATKKLSGEMAPSLKETATVVAKLSAEIKNLSADDPNFPKKLQQLKQATLEYNNQRIAISGLSKEHEVMGSSFLHLTKTIAEGVGIYDATQLIIEKTIEFAKGIIDETLEAEQANTRLKNILDNIGRSDVIEKQSKEVEKLADSFKALKPEAIKGIFTQLDTYGKLSENQINQLTPVIIDFARKLGGNVQEATSILLKSLEGNNKGLKEYGINIKEGKDLTERFGLIMTDLKLRVDGAEQSFENTSAGGIAKFKVAIAEIQKNIGQFIENLFAGQKSAETLFQEAKQKTEEYNNTLPPLLKSYDELKSKTNLNKTEQGDLQAIIQKIISIVPDAATVFDKYGAALDINKEKVTSFLKENDKFLQVKGKSAIDDLISQAQKSADVIKLLSDNRNRIVSEFNRDFPNGGLTEQGKSLNDLLGGISENIAKEQDKIIATANKLKDTYRKDLPAAIQAFVDKANQIKFGASSEGNDPLINTKKNAQETTLTIEALRKKIQDLDSAFEKLSVTDTKAIKANQEAREKLQSQLDALDGKQKDKKAPENQFVEDIQKLQQQADKITELNKTEFQKKLIEAQRQFEAFQALINQQFQKGQLTQAQHDELEKQAHENLIEEQHQLRLADIKKTFDEQTKADKKLNDERFKIAMEGFKRTVEELAKLADSQLGDKRAEKELAVLNATGVKKIKAEIDQLNQEETIALNAEGVTAEKRLLIEKQFEDKRKKVVSDGWKGIVQQYAQFVNQLASELQSFFSLQNQSAQADIDRETAANEKKKTLYQNQLDGKLISQTEYNRKVAALDKQVTDKQNALKLKEFNQNKALSIAHATANVAEAITKIFAEGGFTVGAVMAGIVAAIGLAEIAIIAKQKPPTFATGGTLPQGPSHSQGGMPILNPRTGQKVAEIEGGEPILSRSTYRNNKSLVDALLYNSMHRGGASLRPDWMQHSGNNLNIGLINRSLSRNRMFAKGGVLPDQSQPQPTTAIIAPEQMDLLIKTISQELRARVVLQDIDDAKTRLNNIQGTASLR